MSQNLSFTNLIDSNQISVSDIDRLFVLANKYFIEGRNQDCQNLILASLFFEPSTRTRFSFESAMIKMGGQVITLEQGESSSMKKGETLSDMGQIMSNYADIIVIRHPQIGSANEFAKNSTVPIINAGDGANQHPTQALVDLYTIFIEKGRLNNLRIGVLGDLKYARVFRSFLTLMSHYSNNHFTLISPPSLNLNADYKKSLITNGCKIEETHNLTAAVKNLDILYVSRIQHERFGDEQEYQKVKNSYLVNKETINSANQDIIIMHALPKLSEIDTEIDNFPQARYFKQAEYGVCVRMALLSLMTQK
jgi:aspartate carbamoyltransferase catalytic subunit